MRMCLLVAPLLVWMVLPVGCGSDPPDPFEQEFALAVRAGRGQLSSEERQTLRRQDHPILEQLDDPIRSPVLRRFAELPDAAHRHLLDRGYLKWRFRDLPDERKRTFRDIVQTSIELAQDEGWDASADGPLDALEETEVGYIALRLPQSKQRLVSAFILWDEPHSPGWVTLINPEAAQRGDSFPTHLHRLQELRRASLSPLFR